MVEDYISKRMNGLLKMRKWTPYRLIKESGASKTSVYNALSGTHGVYVHTLNQMVEALGMSMHQFFEPNDRDYFYISEDERIMIERLREIDDENERMRLMGYIEGFCSGKRTDDRSTGLKRK